MQYTDAVKSPPKERIILVEDDADLRESIVKYMTLTGYDITGVGSALEFYTLLSGNSYRIAILDIALPDQTGLVIAQYLRSNTDMQIILLTAKSTLDDKLSGYHSGADMYIVKPVDNRELESIIKAFLERCEEKNASDALLLKVNEQEKQCDKEHAPAWSLFFKKLLLRCPDGREIRLTGKERDFLKLLSENNPETTNRQELLTRLGYISNEYGHRSLESLVNRLRRKVIAVCGTSPIQTIYGVGYIFSEPVLDS